LRLLAPLDTAFGLLGVVGGDSVRPSRVDRAAVVSREKILLHLGLPADLPSLAPARAPPWLPGVSDHFDDGGSADREWSD